MGMRGLGVPRGLYRHVPLIYSAEKKNMKFGTFEYQRTLLAED